MGTNVWDEEIAAVYDRTTANRSTPEVLGPTLDLLAELAGDGPALELAIGTGRVALPLRERGVDVHGIELSQPMVDQLRAKPGGADVPVTVGDMTSATADGGPFSLAYLVFNTITNVTTQDEQVEVFRSAASHLAPGGRFVIELIVPTFRELPLGVDSRVIGHDDRRVSIETYDDPVGQVMWSRHWWTVDGRLVHHAAPYRHVWPSELDLMARLAGMRLEHRWSGWDRAPFTAESTEHVSVWRLEA